MTLQQSTLTVSYQETSPHGFDLHNPCDQERTYHYFARHPEANVPAPMKRIDTTKRPLARFAAQLRDLWDSAPAGRPSVSQIAKSKQASRAAIYAAMSGRVLPSRNTLQVMVIAWSPGAERDVPQWMAFRSRCADALRHVPQSGEIAVDLPSMTDDGQELTGDELRRMRLNAGLSLTALANKLNYSKGYLSKVETRRQVIPQEMARHVRRALGG